MITGLTSTAYIRVRTVADILRAEATVLTGDGACVLCSDMTSQEENEYENSR